MGSGRILSAARARSRDSCGGWDYTCSWSGVVWMGRMVVGEGRRERQRKLDWSWCAAQLSSIPPPPPTSMCAAHTLARSDSERVTTSRVQELPVEVQVRVLEHLWGPWRSAEYIAGVVRAQLLPEYVPEVCYSLQGGAAVQALCDVALSRGRVDWESVALVGHAMKAVRGSDEAAQSVARGLSAAAARLGGRMRGSSALGAYTLLLLSALLERGGAAGSVAAAQAVLRGLGPGPRRWIPNVALRQVSMRAPELRGALAGAGYASEAESAALSTAPCDLPDARATVVVLGMRGALQTRPWRHRRREEVEEGWRAAVAWLQDVDEAFGDRLHCRVAEALCTALAARALEGIPPTRAEWDAVLRHSQLPSFDVTAWAAVAETVPQPWLLSALDRLPWSADTLALDARVAHLLPSSLHLARSHAAREIRKESNPIGAAICCCCA
jgi:hypothetical protein